MISQIKYISLKQKQKDMTNEIMWHQQKYKGRQILTERLKKVQAMSGDWPQRDIVQPSIVS